LGGGSDAASLEAGPYSRDVVQRAQYDRAEDNLLKSLNHHSFFDGPIFSALANLGTGGLYSVAQAGNSLANGGNVIDALNQIDLGPAAPLSDISTDTLGRNTTLGLKAAVTGYGVGTAGGLGTGGVGAADPFSEAALAASGNAPGLAAEGAGAGYGAMGGALGSQAAQQGFGLVQQLFGGGPPGMPGMPGMGPMPVGSTTGVQAQGLNSQQAALTANQSEAHKGLAPWFAARQAGQPLPGGGISGPSFDVLNMVQQYYTQTPLSAQ
jgi:hypothetical protein